MPHPDKNRRPPPEGTKNVAPPEIKLPFEKKRHEIGEWVYDNRVSISVTVIIYLALAIFFVSARIVIDRRSAESDIVLNFEELDKLQQEADRTEEIMGRLAQAEAARDDLADVRNAVSNENAAVERLNADDGRVQNQLSESREMYEEAIREQQLFEQVQHERQPNESVRQDVKMDGHVTVSYSLSDPIRHAAGSGLFVPAYMCEAGGRVVVSITVNRNGDVTAANVVKSVSSSDRCVTSAALDAARRSRFNVDPGAPAKHTGTITYIFIPQ